MYPILENAAIAIGCMTISYLLSLLFRSLADRAEESVMPKFFIYFLSAIHYLSAICSLFVGFFFYFQSKQTKELENENTRLRSESEKYKQQIKDMELRISILKKASEGKPKSYSPPSKNETHYYMESANGMTVRVPASRLEAWEAEQDRIRRGEPSKLREYDKSLAKEMLPPNPKQTSTQAPINNQAEEIYYMEAANGMIVRVPASRLEAWEAEQDKIRRGEPSDYEEYGKKLVADIVRQIYGDNPTEPPEE